MEKRCRRARTCCQPTVRPLRLLPMALASTASQFIALPSSKNSRALSRQLTYPPHLQFGTARKGCPGQFAVIRGLAWPQLAQERGNGVPHAWQNLAASGTTAVQFGHSTLAPNTHELCKLSRQCCPKNLERWLINLSASAFGQLARDTQ